MNVVALIARRFHTDVCSAYLLEPDRANLVLAATLGLRPQCIGTLRLGLHEGLAGLVAEQVRPVAVEQVKNHPRFKYFSEAGEDAYQSFLGVPLIDRGVLQGVLVVQTMEARVFREDEDPNAGGGGGAGGAGRQRSAHARSLHRARRRSGCGRWPAICGGAGITTPPACSAIWIRCAGGSSITIPISLLSEMPLADARAARRRAGAAQPDQLRVSPPAGISAAPTGPGAPRTPACCGRGRWRISPPSSGCTNRCRSIPAAWACWPAITSRARPIWTFRWSASACSTARATSASAWTRTAGSRKNIFRPMSTSCRWSRPSARTASRSRCRSRLAAAPSAPRSGA